MEHNEKENLIKEENFHDNWSNSIKLDDLVVKEFFEASSRPENQIILQHLGDINGKTLLDLGCGAGESSIYFALKGAKVTAADISSGMLEIVKKLAEKYSVHIETQNGPSTNINVEDNSFDIVYASNILHHVDIEKTLIEINRILKPGGTFVSYDPLAHNPLINIYRKIATEVRTEDEHPLKMKDIKLFKKYFDNVQYETTWFFTLLIFIKYFCIDRINPNKERYWEKVIKEHKQIKNLFDFLYSIDKIFLKFFPFMKRYCWNICFICQKKSF